MTVIDLINEMPVIFGITIGIFLICKAIIWIIAGTPRVRVDEAEQMRNARAETLLLTIKMQHEAKMDEIKMQHEPKRRERIKKRENRTARKPLSTSLQTTVGSDQRSSLADLAIPAALILSSNHYVSHHGENKNNDSDNDSICQRSGYSDDYSRSSCDNSDSSSSSSNWGSSSD
jgi:hypothetical protein